MEIGSARERQSSAGGTCRCCLSTGALRSMERGRSRRGYTPTYSDMLRDTFGLTLARVRGALLICGVCEIRLRDALAFRTQVLDSEQAFLKHSTLEVRIDGIIGSNYAHGPEEKNPHSERCETDGDEEDYLDDDTPLNTISQVKCEQTEPVLLADAKSDDDIEGEPTTWAENFPSTSEHLVSTSKTTSEGTLSLCVFCNKLFKYKKHFKTHQITCEWKDHNLIPTVCSFCPTTFDGKTTDIIDHMWRVHRYETNCLDWRRKEFHCDICERKFTDIIKKVEHIRNAHHSCKICQQKFRNMYERNEHALSHPVHCPVCKEAFATKITKEMHIRNVHGTRCVHCKERFTQYAMLKHKMEVHGAPMWNCGACDKSYISKLQLTEHHRKTHMLERNLPCPQCDYKAFDKSRLNKHMVSHNKEKKFMCQYCNKTFARASNLSCHERIHTGDKRQVCKLCGQAFVQRASLKYHLEKYHPGDV